MCRLYLLVAVLANNWFRYNLDTLGIPSYSFISALKGLLKGTYTYKCLLLTFLLNSLIIINGYYTLSISLYRH